ncbi:MAG: hypothetical protein HUU35_08235, partial [Armatimonadetes bacterium]|nr:hypothetical protein [Armatimonadota bacterium]
MGLVIWAQMGARGAGSGSDLEVGPTNLVFDVLAGDPTATSQTFELRSLSGSEQSWFTSVNWPQLIRVDPASGSLAASEKANLTVSVLASNVWPSKGGYAGDISIMPWGRPKVSFHIRTRPSARLTGAPGALSFGLTPDGVAFKRELPLRNSGFDTPGAGLVLFDDFFRVVKDPSSDTAWQDHWWIYISISGMNLVLTNQESRVFPVTAGYDWDLPPGRYRATLISDAPWQLADALALPLELVVGEDFIAVDRLTPVPGTVLAEQSKVVFDAQVRCQVQSVESGRVRLIVYDPGGVSAIGYSDWVEIDRLSGQSNLVLQTPPVTIHRYSNVVVKAALTVYHRDGYDWKYSDAYVYPVSTNAAVTNVIVIGEKLQLPGRFEPVSTNHIKVEFERSADGTNYVAEAPVEALTATTVTVRVPVNLLGRNDAVPAATGFASNVTVRITTGLPQNPQVSVLPVFWLLPPRLLIHDEVFVAPGAPAGAAPPVPTTPSTL